MIGFVVALIYYIAIKIRDIKTHSERTEKRRIRASLYVGLVAYAISLFFIIGLEDGEGLNLRTRDIIATESYNPMDVDRQQYHILSDNEGNISYYFYIKDTNSGEVKTVKIPETRTTFVDESKTVLYKNIVTRKPWVRVITLLDCKSTLWTATVHIEEVKVTNQGNSWLTDALNDLKQY